MGAARAVGGRGALAVGKRLRMRRHSFRPRGRSHTGPLDPAGETYARLRARADELGYRVRGAGHEVYVSSLRRAACGKLRRIVRLPIAWPRPDYAPGEDKMGRLNGSGGVERKVGL